MPKSRIPYPPEFRQQMIELVRSGRSPGSSITRPPAPAASKPKRYEAVHGLYWK